MKNAILSIFTILLMISLFDCTDKKTKNNSDATVDVEEVKQLEQEAQQIESLEQKIDEDIKELDALLEEIE